MTRERRQVAAAMSDTCRECDEPVVLVVDGVGLCAGCLDFYGVEHP